MTRCKEDGSRRTTNTKGVKIKEAIPNTHAPASRLGVASPRSRSGEHRTPEFSRRGAETRRGVDNWMIGGLDDLGKGIRVNWCSFVVERKIRTTGGTPARTDGDDTEAGGTTDEHGFTRIKKRS